MLTLRTAAVILHVVVGVVKGRALTWLWYGHGNLLHGGLLLLTADAPENESENGE
jgi:hypothetical protein